MKKKILKTIFACFISIFWLLFIWSNTFWVKVFLPNWTRQEDVNIPQTQINSRESTVLRYISFINKYLWFIIIWFCMACLVYAWILFITSSWDKEKVKWGRDIALVSVIAILISMLSYFVVNLIINLF